MLLTLTHVFVFIRINNKPNRITDSVLLVQHNDLIHSSHHSAPGSSDRVVLILFAILQGSTTGDHQAAGSKSRSI
jgi:hypothetical protein